MALPSRDSVALQTFTFEDVGLLANWNKLKNGWFGAKGKLLAKNWIIEFKW